MKIPPLTACGVLSVIVFTQTAGRSTYVSGLATFVPYVCFAGGFGAAKPRKSKKKKKKQKQQKGLSVFGDTKTSKQTAPQTAQKDAVHDDVQQPEFDRWGLPPPTEEDIFPLMPPGTALIAADGNETLQDVEMVLKNHISLDLSRFDDSCIERSTSSSAPPMKLRLVHRSPPVLVIENFFTSEECEQVKQVTKVDGDASSSSLEVTSATFSPLAFSKRTSTSWFCFYEQMPTLLAKAKNVLGIPLKQMEEPQIVRYRTGEEFSWHYDEIPPTQLENGGQRVATLLVYLNDVERGGGTIFRDLKGGGEMKPETDSCLTVQPKQGSALLFFPAFGDGRPDDRTLHKGEVALDEKWITQMWIHERAYKPVVPPGNSHEAATKAMKRVAERLGYE